MPLNTPWLYVRTKDNVVFHIYDFGIDANPIVNLEYIFPGTYGENEFDFLKKTSHLNSTFYRCGLRVKVNDYANTQLSKYIGFSQSLGRLVNRVNFSEIVEKIDSRVITQKFIDNPSIFPETLRIDLLKLFEIISQIDKNIFKNLGMEGSTSFNVVNEDSDLDLVVYGQENFNMILQELPGLVKKSSDIEMFSDSEYGHNTLYNARRWYLDLSEKEMINHECRKIMGFIKNNGKFRKFSIVGILNQDDEIFKNREEIYQLYSSKYEPLGICEAIGEITYDEDSGFRPSLYGIKVNNLKFPTAIPKEKIKYIVDFIGTFHLQCKIGEKFKCKGYLDKVTGNNGEEFYRIIISHWDDHIENKFYLKTLWK